MQVIQVQLHPLHPEDTCFERPLTVGNKGSLAQVVVIFFLYHRKRDGIYDNR